MKQDFLEAGLVRNTHALRGEVKFECWLDGDQPLSGVKNLYPAPREENPLELNTVRRQGDLLLVSFCGIDSVEKAQIYKGKTLYVSRSQIDPRGEKVFFCRFDRPSARRVRKRQGVRQDFGNQLPRRGRIAFGSAALGKGSVFSIREGMGGSDRS